MIAGPPTPTVRTLHGADAMAAADRLLQQVWRTTISPIDVATLQALAHSGNYVAGAFVGEEVVGCAVGFFAAPAERSLHSHIAGVHPGLAGTGVGTRLKQHQRDWCLARGVESITWTYDPLIARNAYFNLEKLGVTVEDYLEDFYGPLDDELNAGSPSDRVFVRWRFGGLPSANPPGGATMIVPVPTDIETLRRDDPAAAAAWRWRLRESLAPLVNGRDWRVAGFLKGQGYRMERRS